MHISNRPFEVLIEGDEINRLQIYNTAYVICTGLYSFKAMVILNYVIMTIHNKIHSKFNKEGHLQILPQAYSFALGANNTLNSISFFRCTTYDKHGEIVIPLKSPEITYSGQTEADVCILLFKHYFDKFIEEFMKTDKYVNECSNAMKIPLTKEDFLNAYDCLFNEKHSADLAGSPLNPFEEESFSTMLAKCSKANKNFYKVHVSEGKRFKSAKDAERTYNWLFKTIKNVDDMKKSHDGLL